MRIVNEELIMDFKEEVDKVIMQIAVLVDDWPEEKAQSAWALVAMNLYIIQGALQISDPESLATILRRSVETATLLKQIAIKKEKEYGL
jgi:hypothetical protein